MTYDWKVDHDTRRIVVRGTGEGVTADTLRLIDEMRDVIQQSKDYDFLYNAVELRIESSPADMMRVANALFRDLRARFRRFAIVVPPSRVGLARIFTALAQPFGITANVFADEDAARDWLASRAREPRLEPGRQPDSPEQ